jgi:hypothetical protein
VSKSSSSKRRTPGVAKGLYANSFEVGHTAFEFVIEFGQTYSSSPGGFHTRIVTSPVYAKALLDLLGRAVRRYEGRFGPTKERGANAR